jgi:hypothetical protein
LSRAAPGAVRALLLFVLLACPAPGAAQGPVQSVTGVVRDTSGAPLAGAEVLLGKRIATTNAQGAFRFDSLVPGRYPLVIRLVGYAPVRSRVGVVAGEPTVLEYFIFPAPYLLPAVVVKGERTGIFGVVGDTGYRAAVGAKVEVLGLAAGGGLALTDSMGRFAFPGVGRGVHVVRVTMGGYTERRIMVELKEGEGRELAVMLAPSNQSLDGMAERALADLGTRLNTGLERERMTPAGLARYAGMSLCDIPLLRHEVGETPIVIVNGITVLPEFPICTWRADDVELVEFGPEICGEVTHSIAWMAQRVMPGLNCTGRSAGANRTMARGAAGAYAGRGGGYVVIWEKR